MAGSLRPAVAILIGVAILLVPGGASATNTIGDGRHWSDGSLSREYVTVVDFTSSLWPVYSPAIKWDEETYLDVVYQAGTCSGSPGHCIDVRVIDMTPPCAGTSGASAGYAVVARYSSTNPHINPDTSYIRLNDACEGSAFDNRDRRAVSCEEQGHMYGLDHATYANANLDTCMGSGDIRDLKDTPRQHDFDMLHQTYQHSHP